MSPILALLATLLGVVVGAIVLVFAFRGLWWLLNAVAKGFVAVLLHFGRFIGGMLGDSLRIIGSTITALVFMPLVIANIVIGRWSASSHFGRAVQDELGAGAAAAYRVFIGHPARFLLLTPLTEGIERRLPEVVAQAPTRDKPRSKALGTFDGYTIVGSLAGGGSGAKLYVAEPSAVKRASFERAGAGHVDQVVIKSFSVSEGSTMPQIVRESRALEAAKKLGLVLDHELSDARFYYVMAYVPGESLTAVTRKRHASSSADGLNVPAIREMLGYTADLLRTLETYHSGGLWHKDIKPDNIIVHDGEAHLVDLGLITPLRSAMTLTTHGTEYFRDPELVRMALRGAKVHEVDGVKFDVYGAGAVLFSVIENSFPAHGGLSQIGKTCPEALRWIVRRSMTDMNQRYASAAEMLADVNALMHAPDMHSMKPADLPSFGDHAEALEESRQPEPFTPAPAPRPTVVQAASPVPPRPEPAPAVAAAAVAERARPSISVTDWWKGSYKTAGVASVAPASPRVSPVAAPAARATIDPALRKPAHEQLASARERVQRARDRAHARRNPSRRARPSRYSNNPNTGVAVAVFLFLAVCVGLAGFLILMPGLGTQNAPTASVVSNDAEELRFEIQNEVARALASVRPEAFERGADRAEVLSFQGHERGTAVAIDLDHDGTPDVEVPKFLIPSDVQHAWASNDWRIHISREQLAHMLAPFSGIEPPDVPMPAAAPVTHQGKLLEVSFLSDEQLDQVFGGDARLPESVAGFGVLRSRDSDRAIDLVAQVKKIIGVRTQRDPEAIEDVRLWLRDKAPEDVKGVLWMNLSEDAEGIESAPILRSGSPAPR
ncbi:MAG: hypothetical protein AAGD00_09695 [Planctomycetota bacterium]